MKKLRKCFSLFLTVSMLLAVSIGTASAQTGLPSTGLISDVMPAYIDDLLVLKGSAMFTEGNVGAHYYVFSGESSTYQSAYVNVKLPTEFNNKNGLRNGYISLGIYGSVHGVDLGLRNSGSGWHPYSFDVTGQSKDFKTYETYGAPSTATNAEIQVSPVNTTIPQLLDYMSDILTLLGIRWVPHLISKLL